MTSVMTLAPSRVTALACIQQVLGRDGEVWECGVFKGETAALIHGVIGDRTLRLFDTFTECPAATEEDSGEGARVRWPWQTSLAEVMQVVHGANVFYHVGTIPDTMRGLESSRIAFVYLDLTLYAGTKGALDFILPRLIPGGSVFVRDYYGSTTKWPGLVRAVDACHVSLARHDYDAVVTRTEGDGHEL